MQFFKENICLHLEQTTVPKYLARNSVFYSIFLNDFLHQKESEALHKREVQLRERERALRDAEKLSHTTDIIIDKVVTREVENRCQAVVEVKLLLVPNTYMYIKY